MARRRQIQTVEEAPQVMEEVPAPSGSSTSTKRVLAFRLTEDGKIDLDGLRTKTREAIKNAIQGSGLLSSSEDGESDTSSFEAKKAVYTAVVPPIYAVLGMLESLIVSKKMDLPLDDVKPVMGYNDAEIAILTEPTATVLAKRMPEGFGWTEEVALALTLVSIHQQKLSALEEVKSLSLLRKAKRVVDIRSEVPKEASVQ